MANKPPKPCIRCGAPTTNRRSLCERHLAQERARTDKQRGTAASRGYDREHDNRFRQGVFDIYGDRCVEPVDHGDGNGHHCGLRASHADHYPKSRRELEAAGLDPNDPHYGRPLCEHHHNQHTGRTQSTYAKRRRA
jgi:5-methylcytosine-specific restriction enzyme A